jgi:hypothetical protein
MTGTLDDAVSESRNRHSAAIVADSMARLSLQQPSMRMDDLLNQRTGRQHPPGTRPEKGIPAAAQSA